MDPNYHYTIIGAYNLFLRRDAPIAKMGLGLDDSDEWNRAVAETFHVYDTTKSYTCYEANTDKFIEYVLTLDAEKARHLFVIGRDFRIVRVPKELADYTHQACRSSGCCGEFREYYVEIDKSKAIIDLTKKTLEDPTPEKLAHLKDRIAFYESVKLEEVHTPVSKNCCDDEPWDE